MVRLFVLTLPLVSVLGCATGYHWRSEEYSDYYASENAKTEARNLDRQKIYYSVDRGSMLFLGVLEKNSIRSAGSRDARMHYIIYDRHHRKVGFISQEGEVSRFDANGQLQSLGEFPIIQKGLKVFFGFPLFSREREYQIFLKPIDPYGDF